LEINANGFGEGTDTLTVCRLSMARNLWGLHGRFLLVGNGGFASIQTQSMRPWMATPS
jgi:hypothetical protein